jgi:heat shock protein HtpX
VRQEQRLGVLDAVGFYDDMRRAKMRSVLWAFGYIALLFAMVSVGVTLVLLFAEHLEYSVFIRCAGVGSSCVDPAIGLSGYMKAYIANGVVTLLILAGMWVLGPRTVLSMAKAVPCYEPYPLGVLDNIAIAAGVTAPELFIIEDPSMNAFSLVFGRRAGVIVTRGLLDGLERPELEGVLAHELSHVKNHDSTILSMSVLLCGIPESIADRLINGGSISESDDAVASQATVSFASMLIGLLMYVTFVPVAWFIRYGTCRDRERLADAAAVEITRNPKGLRTALEKLRGDTSTVMCHGAGAAHLWFESPTDRYDRAGKIGRLLMTHPDISDRVQRMSEIEGYVGDELW